MLGGAPRRCCPSARHLTLPAPTRARQQHLVWTQFHSHPSILLSSESRSCMGGTPSWAQRFPMIVPPNAGMSEAKREKCGVTHPEAMLLAATPKAVVCGSICPSEDSQAILFPSIPLAIVPLTWSIFHTTAPFKAWIRLEQMTNIHRCRRPQAGAPVAHLRVP